MTKKKMMKLTTALVILVVMTSVPIGSNLKGSSTDKPDDRPVVVVCGESEGSH